MKQEIVAVRPSRPTHLATTQGESAPDQVAALLAPLFALFQVEKEVQRIYVQHLSDIPVDRLARAIDTAIETLKFRPAVAELRDLARLCNEPGPRSEMTPEQVAALRDCTNVRVYRDPRDNDTPEGRRWRQRQMEQYRGR